MKAIIIIQIKLNFHVKIPRNDTFVSKLYLFFINLMIKCQQFFKDLQLQTMESVKNVSRRKVKTTR